MAQVEDFKIRLDHSTGHRQDDQLATDAAIRSFEQFFRTMPRLRNLCLEYTERSEEESADFVRSFLKIEWPELETLTFLGLVMWADFWDFLSQHRHSLKRPKIFGRLVCDLLYTQDAADTDWHGDSPI